jgi:hypothetical protein
MRLIPLIILSILSSNLYSQMNLFPHTTKSDKIEVVQSANNIQDKIAISPFGPVPKSNIHYIGRNQHIEVRDNSIQIIDNKSDTICGEFLIKKVEKSEGLVSKSIYQQLSANSDFQDGWITYSLLCAKDNSYPISSFSVDWIVPSSPPKRADQLIYIFNGIQTIDSGVGHIIQPMLQWGVSPAGGGDYWAICNWYVTSKYYFFHDSLIRVNPGDTLRGIIKLTSYSNNLFNYNASFYGYPTSLQVDNFPLGASPYIALEAYNVKSCDEYPADEKMRMYNIQIMTDSIYPTIHWCPQNIVSGCGQFTNIINESSENGEINIHFHKPYTEDDNEDIYVYPNPFKNRIHISLTNPVFYCRIEVFNSLGNLILTESHETLEYSYNLSLQNCLPGLYFIKIYYKPNKHSYERSYIYKLIKIKE